MSEEERLSAYAEEIQRFSEERDWTQFHTPKDLAIGLVSESAELLELFRFLGEEESLAALDEQAFRQEVADELGDAFFFLMRFCQRFEFDLMQVAEEKLEKSREKYPVEDYRGKNRKVLGDDPAP